MGQFVLPKFLESIHSFRTGFAKVARKTFYVNRQERNVSYADLGIFILVRKEKSTHTNKRDKNHYNYVNLISQA